MADWWEATRDLYLGGVSKLHILSAVAEVVSPQAAENIKRLKKDAMVVRAEELLADFKSRGVTLLRKGTQIHFRSPSGTLTDSDKDALRAAVTTRVVRRSSSWEASSSLSFSLFQRVVCRIERLVPWRLANC